MPRRNSLAACACLVAALAQIASLPARAQTSPGAILVAPGGTQTAPETPAATAQPPAAEVDPILAQVRQQLAEPARGSVIREDRAALAAHYGSGPLVWVSADGLNAKARAAMAEIAKADDWGLPASAFELRRLAPGETSPAVLAGAEIRLGLAVLKYARFARGGRIDPTQISRNLDVKPPLADPQQVVAAVAATDTPDAFLRFLHPQHPQFKLLRQALVKARGGASSMPEPGGAKPPSVKLPDGPQLKLDMQHPHVALLRQRLDLPAPSGEENVYDQQVQDAVKAFQQTKGIQPTGMLTPRTRSALNGQGQGQSQPRHALSGTEMQRLLVNMERWRWMPESLGELHVWDNVPEYQTRVFKKGQLIHQAKIIVGKPETPTPTFSANMKYIVFHPEWGVPDGIKSKEILPSLRSGGGGFFGLFGGNTSVLQRHNLRVSYNGRLTDPSQINWSTVDMRRVAFIQPAGPSNVLGIVKFRFPNKHDVYMHDTPQRDLFEKDVRTFSHGCIRVQNPGKLAEILLEEDKGWSAQHVRGLLAPGGYNNQVELTKEIPVHVTYFTAVASDDGKVHHYGDLYGLDSRVAAALGGRALPPEAASGEEGQQPAQPQREVRKGKSKQKNNDFFSGLFGN